jgi:hypothetical protein
LGFKIPEDCNKYEENSGERALCYHEVAVSYATFGDAEKAISWCASISDIQSPYANGQANLCFADIARLLRDRSLCDNIQKSPYEDIIGGAAITKEICELNATPQSEQPTCAVAFVLLFFVLFSFFNSVHDL